MANYCCVTRTNYFRVKDEDEFRELMSRVYGAEDSVDVWEFVMHGVKRFAFGCYGGISGVSNAKADEDDDAETSYDEFIAGLQRCVAPDDAIIITEAGNEKLRYVIGQATVITTNGCEVLDVTGLAAQRAREMLGDAEWQTRVTY